jgi:FeS assembly SUF system protein
MEEENIQEKNVNLEELKEEVIKVLKSCYDPEIPVNIYDLGLIYDIKLATNGDVLVIMTLTSPACPVAGTLPIEIQEKLREHPMINSARVEITFDPPWDFDKMSEEAKLELGFL